MLTRFVAISLILALIGSNFSRFLIYAGFEANRSYIAKELCENKERPWMHCNGRCYLMKKIKAAEEKEKKQEREDKRNSFQEAFTSPQRPALTLFSSAYRKTYPQLPVPGVLERALAVFQPPKVA